MTETLIITETTAVERTLAAGTVMSAQSDVPAEGPWNAMLSLEFHDIADPSIMGCGTGVQVESTVKTAGTYRITVTPERMPFTGTLVIG